MDILVSKSGGRKPAIAHPQRERAYARVVVLDAARKLFREYHYDQVSVEKIAAAAGVTRYTLKNHFVSKQEIYRLTRDTLIAELAESVADEVPIHMTAEAGLQMFLKTCFRIFAETRYRELRRSMARDQVDISYLNESFDHQIRNRLLRIAETFILYKSDKLRTCPDGPRNAAAQLIFIAEGLASRVQECGGQNLVSGQFEVAAQAYARLLDPDHADGQHGGDINQAAVLRSVNH